MAKNLSFKHYDYINHILQWIGFRDLQDYDTLVQISKISKQSTNLINQTLTTDFRELFQQRPFNLTRYPNGLETPEQVSGFIRKICGILDVSIDTYRVDDISYLRLKPPNTVLRSYLEKMATSRQVSESQTVINANDFNTNMFYTLPGGTAFAKPTDDKTPMILPAKPSVGSSFLYTDPNIRQLISFFNDETLYFYHNSGKIYKCSQKDCDNDFYKIKISMITLSTDAEKNRFLEIWNEDVFKKSDEKFLKEVEKEFNEREKDVETTNKKGDEMDEETSDSDVEEGVLLPDESDVESLVEDREEEKTMQEISLDEVHTSMEKMDNDKKFKKQVDAWCRKRFPGITKLTISEMTQETSKQYDRSDWVKLKHLYRCKDSFYYSPSLRRFYCKVYPKEEIYQEIRASQIVGLFKWNQEYFTPLIDTLCSEGKTFEACFTDFRGMRGVYETNVDYLDVFILPEFPEFETYKTLLQMERTTETVNSHSVVAPTSESKSTKQSTSLYATAPETAPEIPHAPDGIKHIRHKFMSSMDRLLRGCQRQTKKIPIGTSPIVLQNHIPLNAVVNDIKIDTHESAFNVNTRLEAILCQPYRSSHLSASTFVTLPLFESLGKMRISFGGKMFSKFKANGEEIHEFTEMLDLNLPMELLWSHPVEIHVNQRIRESNISCLNEANRLYISISYSLPKIGTVFLPENSNRGMILDGRFFEEQMIIYKGEVIITHNRRGWRNTPTASTGLHTRCGVPISELMNAVNTIEQSGAVDQSGFSNYQQRFVTQSRENIEVEAQKKKNIIAKHYC